MRNLPAPARDDDDHDLEIALQTYRYRGAVRGYAATAEERQAVIALYDEYDRLGAKASDLLKGADLDLGLIDALHHAYSFTHKTRKLASIRTLVFGDVEACPICGIDDVDELDHHLPQSRFKALSIYPRNLIPSCHDCNDIKKALVGNDADAVSHLPHAYFDQLPEGEVIVATATIAGNGLLVNFEVNDLLVFPPGLAARLKNQMEKLQLDRRYKGEINEYMNGQALSLHLEFARAGPHGVLRYLTNQARLESRAPSHSNHWKPVLLRALAQTTAFVGGGFADVFSVPQDVIDDMLNQLEIAER